MMKIYRSDTLNSVHSTPRIRHVPIPVFNFKGVLTISESDKWYPPTSFIFTGGYVTSSEPGSSSAIIEIWKHTYHSTIDGTIVVDDVMLAIASLSSDGIKGIFGSTATLNAAVVTVKDYITVKSITDSGHGGVTVQIFGDRP